jgi:hypothetical protein
MQPNPTPDFPLSRVLQAIDLMGSDTPATSRRVTSPTGRSLYQMNRRLQEGSCLGKTICAIKVCHLRC